VVLNFCWTKQLKFYRLLCSIAFTTGGRSLSVPFARHDATVIDQRLHRQRPYAVTEIGATIVDVAGQSPLAATELQARAAIADCT